MPGALQTEALAVINETPGGDGLTRHSIVRNMGIKLAGDYLQAFPQDDATATTQAWLFAGGGTNANPSVFTIGAGLTLSINTSGAVAILATTPASTSITVPGSTTRGGVRRLLAALGVAFTG